MSIVSATSNALSQSNTTTATQGTKSLGKDDFLKLLMAQVQYQDPLKPIDNTQMTAQLAQFSSLEQLQNLNTQFTTLGTFMQGQSSYAALNLVGKTVKAQCKSLSLTSGVSTGGSFSLDQAATVTATITDSTGTVVKTINLGALSAGDHSVAWDGTTASGGKAPDGVYTVDLTAKGANGKDVNCTQTVQGQVTAINYSSSGMTLTVNGMKVNLVDVEEVTQGPTTSN
ncbi:MAG: flagellar hook assembly protein FlgD [Deltaproteobacteria bacterium]|nr:flagellar hook assembly protein FlgD [Deltaproteobacteria bacterium]